MLISPYPGYSQFALLMNEEEPELSLKKVPKFTEVR